MQDILSDLRKCVDVFLYDNDEFVLNYFYNMLKNDKNDQLNNEFNSHHNLVNGNYNFYCMLIIFILTSDYYEYCKYKQYKNNYIKWLDNKDITFNKVINRFIVDKKYAIELLFRYFDYQKSLNDILTTSCINNILENDNLKKQIMKINPYIWLEYSRKKDFADFEEEDIIKYYFCEVYEECENKVCADISDEELIALTNEMEDFTLSDYQDMKLAEIFRVSIITKLADFYNNDENKVRQALQFIIYDIFRSVIRDSKIISQINEISAIVINYKDNPSELVNMFIFDLDFSVKLISWYNYYTLCKIPDNVPRTLFIDQVKTLNLLKKYNPFHKGDD